MMKGNGAPAAAHAGAAFAPVPRVCVPTPLRRTPGANCLRIVPNSAVKFLTYEHVSRRAAPARLRATTAPRRLTRASARAAPRFILEHRRKGTPDAEMTPLLRLGAGAVAGIIAMSATYPLDMVRGRLTVQADGSAAAYTGLVHATRTIAAQEGMRAFYKGWLPSVIGVVPYVGLNFAVYETLKVRRSRGRAA
jgi:solute carrier family 25 phosphate transporter 23/24/25/41